MQGPTLSCTLKSSISEFTKVTQHGTLRAVMKVEIFMIVADGSTLIAIMKVQAESNAISRMLSI